MICLTIFFSLPLVHLLPSSELWQKVWAEEQSCTNAYYNGGDDESNLKQQEWKLSAGDIAIVGNKEHRDHDRWKRHCSSPSFGHSPHFQRSGKVDIECNDVDQCNE